MYVIVLEVRSRLQSMLVLINHLACFVNVYVPLSLLGLRTLFLFDLENVLCSWGAQLQHCPMTSNQRHDSCLPLK